jgi:nicotinamide-nucleotide amidase
VTASDALTRLGDRGLTLAVAESVTGGRLAASFTSVPGASRAFVGGVVSYATAVKVAVLGVETSLVAAEGVISAACAQAMATGARRVLGADVALATTGVAGPEEQEGHPAGTAFVGLASAEGAISRRLSLSGSRSSIQDSVVAAAVELLEEWLSGGLPVEQPGLG